MKFWVTFLAILPFFISGCFSSSYGITYNTNPTGANLVCGGQSKGYTPVTLYYTFKDGYYSTVECEAIWISGARATFPNWWGDAVEEYPSGVQLTLQGPEYPDLDKDMQFAFQVQQMKQQQEMQERQLQQQQLQQQSMQNQNAMQNQQFQQQFQQQFGGFGGNPYWQPPKYTPY